VVRTAKVPSMKFLPVSLDVRNISQISSLLPDIFNLPYFLVLAQEALRLLVQCSDHMVV